MFLDLVRMVLDLVRMVLDLSRMVLDLSRMVLDLIRMVLDLVRMVLDLSRMEQLWKELKSRVHKRRLNNIAELKAFAMEECSNIPTDTYKNLLQTYKKRMVAVIAAMGGHIKY